MRWKSPLGSAYGSKVATFPPEKKELRCCLHHTSGCDTPSLRVSGCGSQRTVLGDDVGEDIGCISIFVSTETHFLPAFSQYPALLAFTFGSINTREDLIPPDPTEAYVITLACF